MESFPSAFGSTAPAASGDPVARVRDSILRAVLEHRLPPGAKLTEEEVAEVFGVGRTVVRAALQGLAHSGILVIARHRGASVANPSPEEAREVFEARALLEPRSAALAAARAGPADIAGLRAHHAAEEAALAAGDLGRAVFLSGAFHNSIADIAGQATLASIIRMLIARSSLVIALYWHRRDTTCDRAAHHRLIGALAAGDAAAASALMLRHLAELEAGLDLRPHPPGRVDLARALTGGD